MIMKIGEASKRYGVCAQTLRAWSRKGKIPHTVTPGGHYSFESDDCDIMLGKRLYNRSEPVCHNSRLGYISDSQPPSGSDNIGFGKFSSGSNKILKEEA